VTRLIRNAGWVALFCVLAGPARAASDTEYDACEKERDPRSVITACSALLQDQAESAHNRSTFLLYRGGAHAQLGEHDRAIDDFSAALGINSDHQRARLGRGEAYLAKRDPDRAVADFSAVIRYDPTSFRAYGGRSVAYRAKGDLDAALADLTKSIELTQGILLHQATARYLTLRGVVYQDKGDREAAIADYRKALELKPDLEPARRALQALDAPPRP
jgi:tetratricopeptide (TPR) repeat protein